ncbi:fasciclin domain-containing protein [Flavobacterium chungnamense]|uniref:FAS1 domain-containing protein n=1 Tax=Flavobacterium chungnamense TaxID=706182 RepID=A0ABP7UTE3_9FLAO
MHFFYQFQLFFVNCSQEDDINAQKLSISNFVQAQTNLTTLGIALERTNLLATLNGDTKYTLFAPTNEAFDSFLLDNGFANINAVPTTTLREILLNHVVTQVKTANDLPYTGYLKTLAVGNVSDNNLSLFINKTNGVVLNGISEVTAANNNVSNGIVHVVDAVIGLPTIVTHVSANPNFNSLSSLLTTTGQPDYLTTLSGSGSFTLFAPYNTALTALNNELPGGVAALSSAQLTKILNYHVVSGNYLASDLSEGQVLSTLETPQSIKVLLSTGPKLKDANNRNCSIIITDIQCTNGVIHVLSQALRPNL